MIRGEKDRECIAYLGSEPPELDPDELAIAESGQTLDPDEKLPC
jgi:hypothetical protein